MVNKEQLLNGFLSYIDTEVLPVLPTAGKWAIGSMVVLWSNQFDTVFNQLSANPVVKSLGVVDNNGLVDSDKLLDAIEASANKYGRLTLTIPVVGTMAFTANDISRLRGYINGGSEGWMDPNMIR